MQKTKTKIITALLLTAMTLALFPLVYASLGNILINSVGPVQPLPISPIPAGGNISLYFGGVTFSGSQFYLLFSADGLSQVSSGDIRYTPLFNVAAVLDLTTAPIVVADPAFPGQWTVGQGWVNGTIPQNIPGGTFYIKAFDGATTALAVTQGIPVIASFRIIPSVGSAGTSIILNGNAFPPNALVNLTYLNPITGPPFITVNNLTQANALGQFNFTIAAPDLKQAGATGDNPQLSNDITFQATLNATTPVQYNATYTELQRGLLQIGRPRTGSGASAIAGNLQNATGIYGNLTSFTSTISVGVGDSLRIVGNSFYPGAMVIKWDNSIDITPAGLAPNQTGFFNTTVTVPTTGLGTHNVTIIDNGLVVFAVFLNVVQSITISPTTGPIGTTVTVNGFGFPASGNPAGTVYNATITFGTSATKRAWALTDANGAFTTTFVVPTSPGGPNAVNATTNDTSLTTAFKIFTVTSSFTVTPSSFFGNDSTTQVKASGTGFDPTTRYFVAIDNLFSPFTNTTNGIAPSSTGILNFSFIGVGFQPGLHVVALYLVGDGSGANGPAAIANFTVLADPLTSDTGLLTAINNTVTQTNTTVAAINSTLLGIGANVTSIKGTVATIQTATGTIQANLTAINAVVTAINGNFATLSTSMGQVTASVSSLSSSISSISSGVATIQTSLGTITSSLGSIDAKITGLQNETSAVVETSLGTIIVQLDQLGANVTIGNNGIATIQTDLGTLSGTVTNVKDGVATIQTNLGTLTTKVDTLQGDVTTTKDNSASLSPLIIVAIVLALIAAIAAIASIVLMRRKIAG